MALALVRQRPFEETAKSSGARPRPYQGRHLAPTTDLRGVLKGVLADQFGLSQTTLAEVIFPDSAGVAPTPGLIA